VDLICTAEVAWRLFESTGSIWAYLAYRRFAGQVLIFSRLSLN
jgi:hypothetical protein